MPHFKMLFASALVIATGAFAQTDGGAGLDPDFSLIDSNSDGRINFSEYNTWAQTRFDQIDANKDGLIDLQELAVAREISVGQKIMSGHLARYPSDSAADRIAAMDSNRDGSVTLQEYLAWSKQRFDGIDSDHDGWFTGQEWARAIAAARK